MIIRWPSRRDEEKGRRRTEAPAFGLSNCDKGKTDRRPGGGRNQVVYLIFLLKYTRFLEYSTMMYSITVLSSYSSWS